MLENLKIEVCEANLLMQKLGLTDFTEGNVSALDKESGYIVIRPSGVANANMTPDDMVVVDINGMVIEGDRKPTADTPTHIEMYKAFPDITGIAHTHSKYLSAFAQAKSYLPALGTTHTNCFMGDIPCTRDLAPDEVKCEFEKNTGSVIVETFKDKSYKEIPAVLVASHGPFAWGKSAADAVKKLRTAENCAELAVLTLAVNKDAKTVDDALLYRKRK